jgi:hypothetical protein
MQQATLVAKHNTAAATSTPLRCSSLAPQPKAGQATHLNLLMLQSTLLHHLAGTKLIAAVDDVHLQQETVIDPKLINNNQRQGSIAQTAPT